MYEIRKAWTFQQWTYIGRKVDDDVFALTTKVFHNFIPKTGYLPFHYYQVSWLFT